METPQNFSNRPALDPLATSDTDQRFIEICKLCQQRKLRCKGGKPGISNCDHCSSKGLDCVWIPASGNDEIQQKPYRLHSSDESGCELRLKRAKTENPKFACPYFQRNPEMHRHRRACAGSGFPDIHRVKEHLDRVHRLPPHCPRCFAFFDSENEVEKHLQAEKACQPGKPPKCSQGYNKMKAELLSKRAPRGQTEADRWKEVYIILFPNDDESQIPVPYQRPPDNIERCKRYSVQKLLRAMEMVEHVIMEKYCSNGTLDEKVRTELQNIARLCISQIEAFPSHATSNQGTRQITVASRKLTSPEKPLAPVLPFTNTSTNTKAYKSPLPVIVQELKKGVDMPVLQNAGAYEATSSNVQREYQCDPARDKDNTSHRATSKLIPHESVKKVQDNNPFRNSQMSSSQSRPTFFSVQNMQVDDGASLNLPDSASLLSNSPLTYVTPTLGGTESSTAPFGVPSSTPSSNPFAVQQSWGQSGSGILGPMSVPSQDYVDSLNFEYDWSKYFSAGGT